MPRFAHALTLALTVLSASAAAGQTYDPAADFSTAANPNGVWQYAWSNSLGGPLTLYPNHVNMQGIDFWQNAAAGDNPPYVSHNGTSSTVNYAGSVPYPPGQLGLHPGPNGEYSVIRWTAPSAGSVKVSGSFYRLDQFATTDVHLLKNGTSIFDGTVNSPGPTPFSLGQDVLLGDTIDFFVGYGNGSYFNDSTGLSATIVVQPVPEPTGLVALAAGLLAGGAAVRRWRASRKAAR